MAISCQTAIHKGSTSGADITTDAVDTTSAVGFVAFVSSYQPAGACTVSDSKGNSWTGLTAIPGSDVRLSAFYCVASSVGSGHTFTASGATVYPSIMVIPIVGANAVSFFDTQNTGQNNSSPVQGTAVTPTNDGSLVLSALAYEVPTAPTIDEVNFDAPTVETFSTGNHLAVAVSRWIQTTKTATHAIWTASGELGTLTIVINAAAGGSGGLPFFMQGDVSHGYKQQRSGGMQ